MQPPIGDSLRMVEPSSDKSHVVLRHRHEAYAPSAHAHVEDKFQNYVCDRRFWVAGKNAHVAPSRPAPPVPGRPASSSRQRLRSAWHLGRDPATTHSPASDAKTARNEMWESSPTRAVDARSPR